MPTVLITGANRGIGLALARQYIADKHTVIATARAPETAEDMCETGADIYALDVSDASSVATLAKTLKHRPVDILINNAGVGDHGRLSALDYGQFTEILAVNTIAPIRMIEAFTPHLVAGKMKCAASISSDMASIQNADHDEGLMYRVSKAGLNMGLRSAAHALARRGITVLALHPGHVATDMGGHHAPVTPKASAAGLIKTIAEAGPSDELRFLDWQGNTLPW